MDINKKVLNEVSKGAKMGMDAIKFVSDKVSDSRFQRVLNVEYLKYKEIFNRVGNIYHNYDLTDDPQETNIMNKAMTWYGIQMNTMTDKSNSNISELLLQGTNMGIIEGRRLLNNNPSVDKNVRQILDDFVVMQEDIYCSALILRMYYRMISVCKYFSGKKINFYLTEEGGFLSSFSLFFIVSLTKSYC